MITPGIKTIAKPSPTHPAWLIAGGALYVTAALLEWLIANAYGASVASIHERTILPGMVHVLATLSIPVSLFPIFRKRLVRLWSLLAAAIIAAVLLAGEALVAGLLAWGLSAAVLVWQRRQRHATWLP